MSIVFRSLLVLALAAPTAADALYRCKDEKGVTHMGFAPPPECANVVVEEVSKSGTVLRRLEPTLTPEQRKAKQLEEAKAKEDERKAVEQQRKDRALLATYGSESDFDRSRDIALQPLAKILQSNEARLKELDKREKTLKEEMEFYTAGKSKGKGAAAGPPAQLVADVEKVNKERAATVASSERTEREMQAVRDRYEADKARWRQLRQGGK